MPTEKIVDAWERNGITRREFLKAGAIVTAALGLGIGHVGEVLAALEKSRRVPVLWLEFQDCAGCTEAVSRSQNPTLASLVLNTLSIEYHETLMAAAGFRAEANLEHVMNEHAGEYVLVVEGSVPVADGGIYCVIGGRTAEQILIETAERATAIIAVGSCGAYGGLAEASPNPTGATGVSELITDKPVVNIPGCPGIPKAITNTIAHFVIFGELPELDELGRPLVYYQTLIHDVCPKRPAFNQGLFAESFDDDGYCQGYCLYKLGCKGPATHNACATLKWNEGTSFCIQSGHPCLGCAEPDFWDGNGVYAI
jgi:hydrogenase small subunit